MNKIILFGAGACGRFALQCGISPLAFTDNDSTRWGTNFEGFPIISPEEALRTGATFVVTIYQASARKVREQLRSMNAPLLSLASVIPVHSDQPSGEIAARLLEIVSEEETKAEFQNQLQFRKTWDYDTQRPPSHIRDIYFPQFIRHREDEVYFDCGAANGDTIREFIRCWPDYKMIVAFEPDAENYAAMIRLTPFRETAFASYNCALSDSNGYIRFASFGDMSSRVDESVDTVVPSMTLDECRHEPTYIKMDIEGAERKALEGAHWTLQVHKPVLAIVAYHKAADLWEIPLLIHALVPSYDLRLRRYAEGASELVWYAVPSERIR
jgi:FkbM family methyltransferase